MLFKIFIFILGAIIGSFLNVCIYRLPKNQSLLSPSSHCPYCKKPIFWYDNIPILSYILLKGRCRFCKAKIPYQYPLVELISALMFLSFYAHFKEFNWFLLIDIILGCGLIVATFIDINYKIIPDEITIYGIIVGFIISLMYPVFHNVNSWIDSGVDSLLGIVLGGGFIYLIGFFGKVIFKRESMGAGDMKLLAMIGAFLGWKLALLIFFIAPVFGALVGIVVKLKTKQDIIPYAPFLSLATFVVMLFGDKIIEFILWY